MDSFFFNITDTSYKITYIFQDKNQYIKRVDISNGIVFFDIKLTEHKDIIIPIKNLDRMVFIPLVKDGHFCIFDKINSNNFSLNKDTISLFCSSKQNFNITIEENIHSNIFMLFISDFILKRYLSNNKDEPIDFLYHKIQDELSLEKIHSLPSDALSLYLENKIIKLHSNMNSIKCESNILEFIIHRFSMIDLYQHSLNKDDLQIVKNAKDYLLQNFVNPPTIVKLSHICATNESKLKKIFKIAYGQTIYTYIQSLKLKQANLLLRDKVLNIGQITKAIGYKHQGHFSKLFFETYGVYPKNLLKSF